MVEILTSKIRENLFSQACDILLTIGAEFDLEDARDLFQNHGATVNGKRVVFTRKMIEEGLAALPGSQDDAESRGRLAAVSPFCNAPFILTPPDGTSRQATVNDVVKMYQLAETNDLYECANPGIVDPLDIDCDNQYLAQVAMLLKYSDKYPNIGMRASKSSAAEGGIYTSARRAIQLIKEIKEDDGVVMAQGICPMAPLSWDEESLLNLKALIDEAQDIALFPCTLSFMTGPESLSGIVIHDLALSLAGIVYIELLKPGTPVAFSTFSTSTDMRLMQPVYGSTEYLQIQVMYFEVCRQFGLNCKLCGCFADGTQVDYQSGMESTMTSLAPFLMTDVDTVWCYPGFMAAFAGASFQKMILDEEMLVQCNRLLAPADFPLDAKLNEKLSSSMKSKTFLTIGDFKIYRREQQVAKIFDKRGIVNTPPSAKEYIRDAVDKEIALRCSKYVLPERNDAQKHLLQKYLPTQCRY